MATLREIFAANRAWADARTDGEIAQHIAAKSVEQVDGSIRNLANAYRPAGGFDYEPHLEKLIPINPVGELLEAAYQAERGYRQPLTATEIEPVVAWIRANPAPVKS